MALEVGSVFARLGAKFDDDGFDRWERRFDSARRSARNDVEADLKGDFDRRGFDSFSRATRSADHDADRVNRSSGRLRSGLLGVGAVAGGAALAGIGALGLGVKKAYGEFEEARKIGAQTQAVIESTGGAANVTAKHISSMAEALSNKTAIDDETIQRGQNVLLTFRDIRNEAGKGNDVFDQATKATLDMSVALGKDLTSSSIMVGKAMNDPIGGITAMTRAGVQFTDKQKETIASLVESGDKMKAQKIILGELNKEFKGSAEAQATPMQRVTTVVNNLFEAIGGKLAPTIDAAADGFADFVLQLQKGEGVGGTVGRIFSVAGDAVGVVGDVIARVAGGISTFVRENQDVLSGIGRNISEAAGLIGSVITGIGKAFSDVFSDGSGIGGDLRIIGRRILQFEQVVQDVYLAVARRVLPGLITAFRGAFQVIRGVIRIISGVLTGDFGKAWDGVKDIFAGGIKLILGILRAATAPFRTAAAAIGGVFSDVIGGAFGVLKDIARGVIRVVTGALDKFLGGISSVLRIAGKIPLVGDKFDKVADAIDGSREKLRDLDNGLDDLPSKANKVQPLINRFKDLGLEIDDARWFAQRFHDALTDLSKVPQLKPVTQLPAGDPRTIAEKLMAQITPPSIGGRVTGTWKYANEVASMFGLHATSSYRTPEHNLEVGGVPGSMHTHGSLANPGAIDLVGPTSSMYAAAAWARAHLPVKEVLVHDVGSGLHLHLGFFERGGKVGPDSGGPRAFLSRVGGALSAFIAGEGKKDEWVISQEGNRVQNVGWAKEALETLTGRQVALHAGGKGIGKMTRRQSTLGSVIQGREDAIEQRERFYSRLDRKQGLSQEEFLVEDADGNLVIDQGAIDHRVHELDELWKTRKQIRGMTLRLRKALLNAQSVLNRLVDRLRRVVRRAHKAIGKASGKKAKKRATEHYENVRGRINPKIDEYSSLSEEYKGRSLAAWNDWKDMKVDLDEIAGERSEIQGTTAPAPVDTGGDEPTFGPDFLSGTQDTTLGGLLEGEAAAGVTADTKDDETARAALEKFWRGVLENPNLSTADRISALQQLRQYLPPEDTAGSGGTGADPGTAAPTPEQIAQAANAQVQSFMGAQAGLFSQFGANFAGGGYGFSPSAGFRFFGGGWGGTTPGVVGGGGGVFQEINLTIADPGDAHVFTQTALHEAQAAI